MPLSKALNLQLHQQFVVTLGVSQNELDCVMISSVYIPWIKNLYST